MEWSSLFKKTGILFFIAISCCFLQAQKYRIFYDMEYKTDSTSSEYTNKKMILDVDKQRAMFYSYKLYQSDSTIISNEKIGRPTMSKSMDYEFMILKKTAIKQISKIHRILYDIYELQEDYPNFNWKILSETKKINNLTCQKATLDYKGRTWEAWFTLDLPYSEGPYLFNGLPGLIISINDVKKNYIFNMYGLIKDYHDIYESNQRFKSIKINKDQLEKVHIDYYNDPYKEAKAGKIMMNFKNEKGEKITPNWNELTKYKQEEIKQNNNPIELSDSINFSKLSD